ncbi:MAG: B12-binding domain-containing protein [Nitrososphaeria archaeon]
MPRNFMRMKENELFSEIRRAVIGYDEKTAVQTVKKTVELGMSPKRVLEEALIPGIQEVGTLFAQERIFIPEVMLSAEVFSLAMKIIKPAILSKGEEVENLGTVLIGTVAGDVHDLGKSLVATLLTVAGFEVFDLGIDVSTELFVKKVRELNPDVLALSALMSTTMLEQREVIRSLKKQGLRDKVRVIVGGAPVTNDWSTQIGADGYAPNAHEAVELVKRILRER